MISYGLPLVFSPQELNQESNPETVFEESWFHFGVSDEVPPSCRQVL